MINRKSNPRSNQLCQCGSGKKYKKCCALKKQAHTSSTLPPASKYDAIACYKTGDLQKAYIICKSLLQSKKNDPDIILLSAIILRDSHKHEQALNRISAGIEQYPDNLQLHNEYINTLYAVGDISSAINATKKAISFHPYNPGLHFNLGVLQQENGLNQEAVRSYNDTIEMAPAFYSAYNNLGNILRELGQYSDALEAFRSAITLEPKSPNIHNNMGMTYIALSRIDNAEEHFKRALELNPHYANAHLNLANLYKDQGLIKQAISEYDSAISCSPDEAAIYSNLLYTLNFSDGYSNESMFKKHLYFNKCFTTTDSYRVYQFSRKARQGNKINIAYVSPDFREHSVASFISPILNCHDRAKFTVYAYYNHPTSDYITDKIRSSVDHWTNISNLSDREVADLIYREKIDILIDLTGHTAGNRLQVFTLKPVPIQITWIGYPNTTGLTNMDYRITDHFADPVGMTEKFYSEQLIRLNSNFSVYQPIEHPLEARRRPASNRDNIIFGSFNNLAKTIPVVLETWAKILLATPNSQLFLKSNTLDQPLVQERIRKAFRAYGISPERLILRGPTPSIQEHLQLYSSIDIALDTFPYNGTTTTCEAMWMGVPVICLAGYNHAGRVGVSILSNTGLSYLIGKNLPEYIAIASKLAEDRNMLEELQKNMRAYLQNSPIMDAKNFTLELEKHYQNIFLDFLQQTELDS